METLTVRSRPGCDAHVLALYGKLDLEIGGIDALLPFETAPRDADA